MPNPAAKLKLPIRPFAVVNKGQRVGHRLAAFVCALSVSGLTHAVIPSSERNMLISLYNSTAGAAWFNGLNWRNTGNTDFNSVGSECSWFGVTCNVGDTQVTSLSLPSNNLVGSLPGTLNALSGLTYLDVSGNQLTGTLPALSGLAVLQTVYVNENQFTGPIPALTGLSSLQLFSAFNNQLSGAIPALTGLTALHTFSIRSNQLSGNFPALSGLGALQFVSADSNQIGGPIPALTGLTALKEFNISANQFTGGVPSLSGLSALQYFDVGQNQLTGSLPALTGLTALQRFYVSSNQLTGAIPAVPSPSALLANNSALCPNQLTNSSNAAWNTATGSANWYTGCVSPRTPQVLTLGPAPTLLVGGSGTVSATVTPSPGSGAAIIYTSLTPAICTVNSATGLVTVQAAAVFGNVCVIAADKANDTAFNSAVQVRQSITITANNCRLDVNGDASLSPGVDGLLIARYLLGFRGAALVAGITLAPARPTAADVETFLGAQNYSVLGALATNAKAHVDGVVIIRYLQTQPAAAMIANTGIAAGSATTVFNAVNSWCM